MKTLLAAITPDSAPDPFPEMEKVLPPAEVPWPLWAWLALGALALVILSLVVIGVMIALKRRGPAAIPPTPSEIAQRELRVLRETAQGMDPYAFGVAVSDVLRKFISGQFSLHATSQTSPEFLASISGSARFTKEDRDLLAAFLEHCDLRKFARVAEEENETLLESASAFISSASKERA